MNELIKVWNIPGGIHPAENKQQSLTLPIGEMPLPPQLVLPLSQHIGAPAKVQVDIGDRVLAGQIIATADGAFSANVHAPTSGIVSTIGDHVIAHSSGMTATCITIDVDNKDEWVALTPCADYASQSTALLLEKIRVAGLAGLGGAGFPTAIKLNPRAEQSIDTLIINGTECEPYITADDILMRTQASEIIAGTLLLAQLLNNPARIVIGIEDNKPEAIQALQEAATGTVVEIAQFPTKYPSGGEKQLIYILTGREVPSGKIPANVGVVCQNVGTTFAAYRAVRFGEPLTKRITTIVGESLDIQRNIEVRLGTPIDYILAQHGCNEEQLSRLVMGGPMMGFTLPDASVPLVKTTNCIMAPSLKELPAPTPAQACIRCGMCAEACPVSLLPQQLFWYAQSEDTEKLKSHNLFDCIECGACSFVCPSHIPLVQYYRAAKGSIRQHDIEKESSDRSRLRFEFRQERIEKETAAKETKREARKLAAAEAKKKLAIKNAAANVSAGSEKSTVESVIASPRKVAAIVSPEKQRGKFERTLGGANSLLEKAQQPLTDATTAQVEAQKASIKQAELKVSNAKKKLDAFSATQATIEKSNDTVTDTDIDPITAAIARAQAKAAMSPREKLHSNLTSLQQRLEKAEEKSAEAIEEGSEKAETLIIVVEKLHDKIKQAELDLAALTDEKSTSSPSDDAATAAIEKAKVKAAAMAAMSADDKLKQQVESLTKRLAKAQARLTKAKAENDDNIAAFTSGVNKLEEKLATAQAQLNSLKE